MRTLRIITGIVVALGVLLAGVVLGPAQASAAPVAPATATPAAALTPMARPKQVKARASRPFFDNCRRSNRFREHRVNFSVSAVLGGRCVTTRVHGVRLVSSYRGHLPSAGKAVDVMVNMRGSCKAGRSTGNRVAHYFMNHAKQHNVRYLIWKNSYWASTSKPRKFRNWRHGMSGGSCTTRHYDHVHVAFQ